MQLVPPAAKLGGGAAFVISSSAVTTTQVKSKLQSEGFDQEFKVSSWRQTSYTFKEIFGNKLNATPKTSYEELEEETKKTWRDKFAKVYKDRDKLKSYRFNLLVAETILKNPTKEESKAKEAIEKLDTSTEVQDFMKNFYQECRNLSQFVFGKLDHNNHWRKLVKKFLNDQDTTTQQDEKEAKYFRDAWVSCSTEETDNNINPNWPYQSKIQAEKSVWNSNKK
ncbi:hypothetical protein MHSWG343_07450 [Candidatus Mycoplasma haematohominis]|uniref:Uncharacterized protein n=1 Tax=Candidatus Mycoplasma haematohominis TaxID=1494318 RepID=A0A478FUG8_9MOLU|nr:hypothetical protein MHSWG343_07450 [Candidatus Mycoplasma haemohominis]